MKIKDDFLKNVRLFHQLLGLFSLLYIFILLNVMMVVIYLIDPTTNINSTAYIIEFIFISICVLLSVIFAKFAKRIQVNFWKALRLSIKRFLDQLFAVISVIILAPLFLLIALAIKIDSKGPILFFQSRVGIGGKDIRIMKFRTMFLDSQYPELYRQNHEDVSQLPASYSLSLITRVGKFLRKHMLDELPQLFNIIRGDLSFVGPRPLIRYEYRFGGDYYSESYLKKMLRFAPGMVSTYHISDEKVPSFEKWQELDLYYVDNWSLRLDLIIIIKTITKIILYGTYI